LADFNGFTCDKCGQGPFPDDERTQSSINFKGKVEGSTKPEDLCVECAKKSVDGLELQRPKKKAAKKAVKSSGGAKPAEASAPRMATEEQPARL
jgi:hypothetical protein